jgi:tyrosyl-tRNA synthetase
MSITDDLICRYFELLTRVPMTEIESLKQGMADGSLNPRDAKIKLAMEIISMYHSAEDALAAREKFALVFSHRDIPEDIPELSVDDAEIYLPKFLCDNGMVESSSDGRRMIKQGGVKINGEKFTQENLTPQSGMVIQVGKRKFLRIII